MKEVKLEKYKHFKGKMYEVIAVGRLEATLEEMVVYKALYESKDFGKDAVWIRPKKIFLEKVDLNGKKVPRFEPVK